MRQIGAANILAVGIAILAFCWLGFSAREESQSSRLCIHDRLDVPTGANKSKSIHRAIIGDLSHAQNGDQDSFPNQTEQAHPEEPSRLNKNGHPLALPIQTWHANLSEGAKPNKHKNQTHDCPKPIKEAQTVSENDYPEVFLSQIESARPHKTAEPTKQRVRKPLKEAKKLKEAMLVENLDVLGIQGDRPPLHLYRNANWYTPFISWPLFILAVGLCGYWWYANHVYWLSQHRDAGTVTESPMVLEDKTIDREGQIIIYDVGQLSKSSVCFRFFGYGALWSRRSLWRQVAGYFALWIVCTFQWSFIIAFYHASKDGPIANLSTILMGTMPFFLAMYINTAFNRWWTILTGGVGGVWQNVNQLCFLMSSHLKGEQFQEQRDAMLRYGLLAHALLYQQLRKQFDLPGLVEEGLLDESEVQPLTDLQGPKCHAVWIFIQDLWTQLYKDKHIEWWLLQEAQGFTTEGRRSCKSVLTYVNCKLPYGWVHLMTCMVNINIFFIVLKTSAFSADSIAALRHLVEIGETPCRMIPDQYSLICGGESFRALVKLICQGAVVAVTTFLYIGFLELGNDLSDPFGDDPHDFPKYAWMAGMRNENLDYFALAGKGTNKPVKKKVPIAEPAS